ncbi:hypothetical protein, partial [Muriicola sp. Z0-33]|uniref:hypothetical protein n=1 Tax=Muriicola sp. Z0-33 TaxID=2816957 RepID=UPI0022390CFA
MKRNLLIKPSFILENTYGNFLFLLFLGTMLLSSFIAKASDTVVVLPPIQATVNGGTLSEDPFFFCVGDGQPDHVSLVSVEGAEGPNA